ncbi:hypothetical protein SIN8267_02370 [Sinobacterium norvegicum]|uniref:Uncharacterized protein n=1 Tax=Sinobacterium norvegicum TaxID=1641715 RepID=A0ABM9AGV2_9GAMM|nr:hypothetical protein SIN8267_02370 [Sinobacterium norvegicum]
MTGGAEPTPSRSYLLIIFIIDCHLLFLLGQLFLLLLLCLKDSSYCARKHKLIINKTILYISWPLRNMCEVSSLLHYTK